MLSLPSGCQRTRFHLQPLHALRTVTPNSKGAIMKRITLLIIAIGTLAGVVALTTRAARHAQHADTTTFVTEKPDGYREWKFISVAHEEGNLNSFASI